ncbi:restriction endonuclease subunit S [Burkholderia multivorans]|uniref:restriction endonuclease subunit S n=1 Tax=Burkholderia multivorans TaxID=87883 RepID=UPI0018C8B898|nr:restriction endonuclease subunit S [Burkholderia multivorans]
MELITYGFTNPMPDSDMGPWKLTAKDIVDGKIRYDTARHTTDDAYKMLLTDKSRPRIGDVLLTKDGSIGRVAVVDRDGICINQSVALLRPNKLVIPRFLAFLLRSPYYQAKMEADSDGSTIKHIYITRVDKMEIAVPPISEQEMYLSLLGAIDDRIDLLRQTNATLESIAIALFKSWFVDFDPVRSKAEGREPEAMDADTAALFPDSFEDSALGEIPKGWGTGTLAELAHLNARTWSVRRHPEFVEYIDLGNVKDNNVAAVTRYAFDDAPSRARRELATGDTLVGTVRPGNRSFAYVGSIRPGLTGSTGFAVLSPRATWWSEFIYLAATTDDNIGRLANLADGGAYPAVRPELVSATPCTIPSEQVARKFSAVVALLFQKKSENDAHIQTLVELRETLLPRLISGKLRLPEAEAQLNEALA